MDNVATSLLESVHSAPDPKLQYRAFPLSVKGGTKKAITVTLTNASSQNVILNKVSISLFSDTDEICLSNEDAFSLVDQNTKRRIKTLGGEQVRVDPKAKTQPHFELGLFGHPENEESPPW